MESLPIGERLREDKMLLSQCGGPAFLRRARRVEDAWQHVAGMLRRKRTEYLDMVGLRVGLLVALAGDLERLAERVPELATGAVARIHDECQPRLRAPIDVVESGSALRSAARELGDSVARFNRRWSELVEGVDLQPINARRDEFNRYYLLEKECAVGSFRIARQGYQPLPPFTIADVFAHFPLLPSIEKSGKLD
jgi:hypothetical protein